MAANETPITNGRGAATILAAATGCCVLGVLALVGDAMPAVAKALNVWKPSGPLSGVTDVAILFWLVLWFALNRMWRDRTVSMSRVNIASVLLFAAGVLLTFPPFMDMLQGK
ncbi:MAG TPA: hypothetical protein VFE18_09250 [Phenylobacterium sp.]|jgi:hypothetical protein|uniref:hypothetical protein n=1 Tax=Phenylobacterium sp. TaxID=1871053 RepID=UPI002D2E8D46|nr:hypothetical protein [Phenylobacterium sp.]HZZ68347.1 hypothetical protein [Phenylobacterium sp.]